MEHKTVERKYPVKWLDEHLGIGLPIIRNYENEKIGLLPKNKPGKRRVYTENQVKYIWLIHLLNKMGYPLQEIKSMLDVDFVQYVQDSIPDKIDAMKKEKEELIRRIGYAETIKLTGNFPTGLESLGTVTMDDFIENVHKNRNFFQTEEDQTAYDFIEAAIDKEEYTMQAQFLRILPLLDKWMEKTGMSIDDLLILQGLFRLLGSKKELGTTHPDVQTLVRFFYEHMEQLHKKIGGKVSKVHILAALTGGDTGLLNINIFGKEEFDFIVCALTSYDINTKEE